MTISSQEEASANFDAVQPSKATAWAVGMQASGRAEWLLNCYRLRCEEEFEQVHIERGIYTGSKPEVIKDFMIFTKLAVQNGVIPMELNQWNWEEYFSRALMLLKLKYNEIPAKSGHLQEQVARSVADIVYGTSVEKAQEKSAERLAVEDAVSDLVDSTSGDVLWGESRFYCDIGSYAHWVSFVDEFETIFSDDRDDAFQA